MVHRSGPDAEDHHTWLGYIASPDISAVTLTVTQAGYVRGADGGLDRDHPQVRADAAALRREVTGIVSTTPARLSPASPPGAAQTLVI